MRRISVGLLKKPIKTINAEKSGKVVSFASLAAAQPVVQVRELTAVAA
jgi:hypothetical protein